MPHKLSYFEYDDPAPNGLENVDFWFEGAHENYFQEMFDDAMSGDGSYDGRPLEELKERCNFSVSRRITNIRGELLQDVEESQILHRGSMLVSDGSTYRDEPFLRKISYDHSEACLSFVGGDDSEELTPIEVSSLLNWYRNIKEQSDS